MKSTITTKDETGSCRSIVKKAALGLGIWLLMLFTLIPPAFAADDDVPFFAGANGAPNIMFVFDNSDSMQDIPNFRTDGTNLYPVRPGTVADAAARTNNNKDSQNWMWRQGVKLNADGTVNENASNVVQYDLNAPL